MRKITRRALLGTAATGSVALAACTTAGTGSNRAKTYDGKVSFLHGVASGDPLPNSVILWTRITPDAPDQRPIDVMWELMESVDASQIVASGTVQTSMARDWTVKVDASNLTPATEYMYRFSVRTTHQTVVSSEGRTRTTAASGKTPVNLGIVSCSNWQFGRFNAYRALSQEPSLDAIVHLGDYLYEYGVDGYGGEVAKRIGRQHAPTTETLTLADYRTRHAQYKTDPDLQAAHAAAPWICTWDDHESANDSYRTGAQNHNPEASEGDWTTRKHEALQAYFEWMPLRNLQSGRISSDVYRGFRFGDIATLHALETRLTGRSESFGWFDVLDGAESSEETVRRAQEAMAKASAPSRTMLGAQQEEWLAKELRTSVNSGAVWQVLGNQVVMAQTKLPNLQADLSEAQRSAQTNPFVQGMIAFSALGLPMNLDAWDGYPAARERLYTDAKQANARLVTLTGDTHTAWANTLVDGAGARRGIELGCTSITSPGSGTYVVDVPDLGDRIRDANDEVNYHDPSGNGYTLLTLSERSALATFVKVSSIIEETFDTSRVNFIAHVQGDSVSTLQPV